MNDLMTTTIPTSVVTTASKYILQHMGVEVAKHSGEIISELAKYGARKELSLTKITEIVSPILGSASSDYIALLHKVVDMSYTIDSQDYELIVKCVCADPDASLSEKTQLFFAIQNNRHTNIREDISNFFVQSRMLIITIGVTILLVKNPSIIKTFFSKSSKKIDTIFDSDRYILLLLVSAVLLAISDILEFINAKNKREAEKKFVTI